MPRHTNMRRAAKRSAASSSRPHGVLPDRRHASMLALRLCPCEPILSLPGVLRVGVGGPEKLGDVVRIEVRPRLDGTGDRDGRGVDAVLSDAGGDQRLRRAQGSLPHREARQCRHWIVGEAAAGDQQGTAASCPQDGRGYLCRYDGTEDIDVVGSSEPLDGSVEDLAWIWQGSVVHDDTGRPGGAEDTFERLAVAVQILDIRADRLYLKSAAAQFRGELVERFAAGDECAAEALAAEAPNHTGADSWSGPDQQEMMGVNRLGHIPPPGRAFARLSAWAAVLGVESPDERFTRVRSISTVVRLHR